jgi:hypothetical protein
MNLEQSLQATWRNFATIFFAATLITLPLHVGWAFAYRDVIAVRELHDAIEQFPGARQVRSIGTAELDSARRSLAIVTAIELVLVPVGAGAVRRVLQTEAAGRLPTVLDAWGHSVAAWTKPAPSRATPAAVVGGAAIAVAAALMATAIGELVAEPVPASAVFAAVGLTQALGRSVGAAIGLVPLALLNRRA